MIIVMAIISILVSIAIPIYQKSLLRTKESLLKNNLFTMRTVIDEYTFDKQKAPQTLQDLVSEGYLRAGPLDPITGKDTWKLVMEGRGDVGHARPSRDFRRAEFIGSEEPGRHAVLGVVMRPGPPGPSKKIARG